VHEAQAHFSSISHDDSRSARQHQSRRKHAAQHLVHISFRFFHYKCPESREQCALRTPYRFDNHQSPSLLPVEQPRAGGVVTMSQSLSAVERSNPPPRRKACLACVKAKRRCDLTSPACRRCAQRQLRCMYASPSAAQPPEVSLVSSQESTSFFSGIPTPDVALDLVPGTAWHIAEPPMLPAQGQGFSALDEINLDPGTFEMSNTAFDPLAAPLDHAEWLDQADEEGPSLTSLIVVSPNPLSPPLWKKREKSLSEVLAGYLQYAVDELRRVPETMVLENGTPWCHHKLYQDSMPASMRGLSSL